MRGVNTEDMNVTCVLGSQPAGNLNQKTPLDRRSPATAWQYQQPTLSNSGPLVDTMNFFSEKNTFHSSTIQDSNGLAPYMESSHNNALNSPNLMFNRVPSMPAHPNTIGSPKHVSSSDNINRDRETSVIESTRNTSVVVKQESLSPGVSEPNQDIEATPNGNHWGSQSMTSLHNGQSNDHLESLEKTMHLAIDIKNSDSSYSDIDNLKGSNETIRVPRLNSNGKLKVWKCKQCSFTTKIKVEYWDHYRIHIKPDKLLTCPECPFVTEFKHHLEYHILNHTGQKPYKCDQCDYRCVNKSMLSSHAKCHSDIQPYRCADCNYSAKYCHSLKLHLRKHKHRPSKVLNPDGTENPYPIIDVYGTRRGPKMKQSSQFQQNSQQSVQQGPVSPNHPMFSYGSSSQLVYPPPFIPLPIVSAMIYQNIQRLNSERQRAIIDIQESQTSELSSSPQYESSEVLDLSKPTKNRRKGRAYNINEIPVESSDDDEMDHTTTMFSNVEVVQNDERMCQEASGNSGGEDGTNASKSDGENDRNNNNKANEYTCRPCGITFDDGVLHSIHVGYHKIDDPFTCNLCGLQFNDKINFNLHLLRLRDQHGET